jgi:hypothetical protein
MAGTERQRGERTPTQTQEHKPREHGEAAPQPVRERWGQDPWVMRWGC